MITGEMRNKVDSIWDTIWTGGITSPITVLEQITYLMFMKLLDDNQIKAEGSANSLGVPLKNKIFKDGICVISEEPRVEIVITALIPIMIPNIVSIDLILLDLTHDHASRRFS